MRSSLIKLLVLLAVSSFHLHCFAGQEIQSREIKIAGLFETEFERQHEAFEDAVEDINLRSDILHNIKLAADVDYPRYQDSFSASKKLCRLVKEGLAAVFGPISKNSVSHVQSVCKSLGLPHIQARWDVSEPTESRSEGFFVNLFPHYTQMSKAFVDALAYWQWTEFTILYEQNDGLIKLHELLTASADHEFNIKVRRLESDEDVSRRHANVDYRPILKELRRQGVTHIVLDCSWNKIGSILHQDAGLVNLDDFRHGGVNITAFRLVDLKRGKAGAMLEAWQYDRRERRPSPLENERGYSNASGHNMTATTPTESALMYDAVHVFAHALHAMDRSSDIQTEDLSCTRSRTWQGGDSCYNQINSLRIDGLSGSIAFDGKGRRTTFELDLLKLQHDGLQKIGFWNTSHGINVTWVSEEEFNGDIENKTLVVTTILEKPYVMKTGENGDEFEGYCIDLLAAVAEMLKFNYSIHVVGDEQYGKQRDDGEWTGMVRELMDGKADLAVASLTISWVREQVIDFTKPFMNLGISILFKKPEKKNPSLFSFLSPLSFEIWIYMVAAYLIVSFTMFVLARFSPYEWVNPHPCNPDGDIVENQFTLLNSLWFTIGSLMQQGSEVAPRAMSTRLVSGIWWFFTLIMISSYTANLAAFLTVERMSSPIENADDLSKQTAIKYGTIKGGSTETFFRDSSIDTYKRMWTFMEANADMSVKETDDGIQKVRDGDYAFLMESTMNEYTRQRDCELMQVGGLLDSKGYGIGTPMGSSFRDPISNAILKLQEQQKLHKLYNKWWKEKGGAKQCDAESNKKDANALAIANVGGVFVLLVGGLVLSLIVGLLEFAWKAHKNAESDKQPLCTEMAEELRFAVQCFGSSSKPAKRPTQPVEPPPLPHGMNLMHLDGYPTKTHTVPIRELYT